MSVEFFGGPLDGMKGLVREDKLSALFGQLKADPALYVRGEDGNFHYVIPRAPGKLSHSRGDNEPE